MNKKYLSIIAGLVIIIVILLIVSINSNNSTLEKLPKPEISEGIRG